MTDNPWLHAIIPPSPVSVNRLHSVDPWGNLKLTKAGRRYKKDVVEALRQQWMFTIKRMPKAAIYEFRYVVYFHWNKLFCASAKAKHPFKARDTGNLDKILEDSVMELSLIDDRCYFHIQGVKLPVNENSEERAEIWVILLDGLEELQRRVASWPRGPLHKDLL